jgi:hypothetical protein
MDRKELPALAHTLAGQTRAEGRQITRETATQGQHHNGVSLSNPNADVDLLGQTLEGRSVGPLNPWAQEYAPSAGVGGVHGAHQFRRCFFFADSCASLSCHDSYEGFSSAPVLLPVCMLLCCLPLTVLFLADFTPKGVRMNDIDDV